MGVAMFHFGDERCGNVGKGERTPLFSDDGVEEHLKKDVAELFAHERVVGGADGVVELVCLFDQVGAERLVGLRGIPFAATAEVVHEGQRVVERRRVSGVGCVGRGRRVGRHGVFCNAE